jgi:enoyl-CoA hydratase
VGVRRARQLTLTGEPIDAMTALAWGLVNEVVPHGRLLPRCRELSFAIAAVAERDVRHAVALYRHGAEDVLAAGRVREQAALAAWAVDRDAAWERFTR